MGIRKESKETMTFNFLHLFVNDFKPVIPEFFLLTTTIFLLVYGAYFTTAKEKNFPVLSGNVARLGLLVLGFTLLLVLNSPIQRAVFFYNCLTIDDLSFFLKVLILVCSFVSICITM